LKEITMKQRTVELKRDVEKLSREARVAGRKVWLAGLGAYAEAEEQGRSLFEELVDKGRTVQKKQQQFLDETFGGSRRRVKAVTEWFTGTFDLVVDRASGLATETLQRFGVPTYEDIRTLNERVAELNKKVETLGSR
jgi:poly(hydroxyalkanoate) granule-associated protein